MTYKDIDPVDYRDKPWGVTGNPVAPYTPKTSALDTQVGGDHYKSKKIQPAEYIQANKLGFFEGCIVKRITRWKDKPPTDGDRYQDLKKIKQEIDLLIELDGKYGTNN